MPVCKQWIYFVGAFFENMNMMIPNGIRIIVQEFSLKQSI